MTTTELNDSERLEPPTLDAYRSSDGLLLYVWCEHCREWHEHSAHGGGPDCYVTSTGRSPRACPLGCGDGPRVAHCLDPNSPYKRNTGPMYTGYVLREVGPFTPEVQRSKGTGG